MCDADVLADLNRYVGVAVAALGAAVIAPGGTSHIWRSITGWLRRRRDQLMALLARWLPFLRSRRNVRSVDAVGVAVAGAATASASAWVWSPNAPVDERIELLRQRIDDLSGRISDVRQQLHKETQAAAEALRALEAAWRAEIGALRQLIEEQEQRSAVIDARGLPVVVIGIALVGIPDELASIPYGVGCAVPFLAVGIALVVGVVSWRGTPRP
jgi:hypothetical protein